MVLRTTRLDQVIEYSPEDLTITVQAGISLTSLQTTLAKHGQHVAIDAPQPDQATIGGILATAGSGPRRFSYGNRREQVIGIGVANPDGVLTKAGGKVVKNVTGYEMTKLYTGSLGTLGVIVEATFKLWPLPQTTGTVIATCPTLDAVSAAVPALLNAHLTPLAVDTLNTVAMNQILPRSSDAWSLAVEFGGIPPAVDRQIEDASRILKDMGFSEATVLGDHEASEFWAKVRDFGRVPGGVTVRATTVPTDLPRLANELEGVAIIARAGNGILYAFWPAGGEADPEAIERLRTVSQRLGGSTVVEDCPPTLKSGLDVWGPPPSDFAVMKRLKEQFDPRGVLNPGRYIGGL